MRYFFDESGNFEFGDANFECSTQAVVAIPDSVYPEVERFVARKCRQWNVNELHATELAAHQIHTVCQQISAWPMELAVHAFDNLNNTPTRTAAWRAAQADKMAIGRERYETEGVGAAMMVKQLKLLEKFTRGPKPRDSIFVQGFFWVEVLHEALTKSMIEFGDDDWRSDYEHFSFAVDGKLSTGLGDGERLFRDTLGAVMTSNRQQFPIVVPVEWTHDPVHPFERNFGTEEGIDLRKLILDNLAFEDSTTHPGIQLADMVAYVVRKAVMQPKNSSIQHAYGLIRDKLRLPGSTNGFRIHALRTDSNFVMDSGPYDHLATVVRQR